MWAKALQTASGFITKSISKSSLVKGSARAVSGATYNFFNAQVQSQEQSQQPVTKEVSSGISNAAQSSLFIAGLFGPYGYVALGIIGLLLVVILTFSGILGTSSFTTSLQ